MRLTIIFRMAVLSLAIVTTVSICHVAAQSKSSEETDQDVTAAIVWRDEMLAQYAASVEESKEQNLLLNKELLEASSKKQKDEISKEKKRQADFRALTLKKISFAKKLKGDKLVETHKMYVNAMRVREERIASQVADQEQAKKIREEDEKFDKMVLNALRQKHGNVEFVRCPYCPRPINQNFIGVKSSNCRSCGNLHWLPKSSVATEDLDKVPNRGWHERWGYAQ